MFALEENGSDRYYSEGDNVWTVAELGVMVYFLEIAVPVTYQVILGVVGNSEEGDVVLGGLISAVCQFLFVVLHPSNI